MCTLYYQQITDLFIAIAVASYPVPLMVFHLHAIHCAFGAMERCNIILVSLTRVNTLAQNQTDIYRWREILI